MFLLQMPLYRLWTSRLVIETVLTFCVRHQTIWRILEAIVYSTIPMLICYSLELSVQQRKYCYMAVAIYPLFHMTSAGWIATTTNYMWSLWCCLGILCIVKRSVERRTKWYDYLLMGGLLLYGANQEQVAALLFGLFLCTILYELFLNKRFNNWLLYIGIVIDVLALVLIFTCPGNTTRFIQETENWFPEHQNMNILQKMILGVTNITYYFLTNLNLVLVLFTLLLLILVLMKTKNIYKGFISSVPLLINAGYCMGEGSIPFEASNILFRGVGELKEVSLNLQIILPVLYTLVAVFCIFLSIVWISDGNVLRIIKPVLLLGAGGAFALLMGFSPTVYASSARPMIFLYFALIMTGLMLYRDCSSEVYYNPNVMKLYRYAVVFCSCVSALVHICVAVMTR